MHRLLASALLATLVSVSSPTAAETEAIEFLYDSPANCPDRAHFLEEVRARTEKLRLAGQARRKFVVELVGRSGTLRIERQAGAVTRRSFDGESCAEVASALALAMALAIDPDASTQPMESLSRDAPAPPSARPLAPAPPPPRGPTAAGPLELSAGLSAGLVTAPAPLALVALGPTLALRAEPGGVRLTALVARTGTTGPDDESARFGWAAGRLELCPVLSLTSSVEFWPCALVEAGALWATGREVDRPQTRTRPWVSAGVASVLALKVSERLSLDLSAGVAAVVTRDEFVFENPKLLVHRPAPVSFSLLLGARFAFL